MIYLDNCASTKPRKEVIDVMAKSLDEDFANPSSLHSFAMEVENKIENVRKLIGRTLGVDSTKIFFTSGGTESSNIFHHGLLLNNNKRKTILTSNQEHPATGAILDFYGDRGYDIRYLKSKKDGSINLNDLKKQMNEDVLLVSLIHINNQLGSINDIEKISEIIRKVNPDTLIYIDGVQSYGKVKIDLSKLDIDGFSFSGHKIHGPKGIGALYIKDPSIIKPTILGGGHESGLRSGTENTNSIIGLGEAVRIMFERFEEEKIYIRDLRDYLIEQIDENISNYHINTNLKNSLDNILNISFLNTKGEVLVHFLEEDEIYISTTSACSSRQVTQTNLEKLNYDTEIVDSSVRICLSYEISKKDIDIFVEKLKDAIKNIRRLTKSNR